MLTNKQIEEITALRRRAQSEFEQCEKAFGMSWENIVEEVKKAQQFLHENAELMRQGVKVAREVYKQLPPRIRKCVTLLAYSGWFLPEDLPMADFIKFAELVESDGTANVDEELSGFLRTNLKLIEERLLEQHSNRVEVLSSAFSAHKEGHYYLSVPVFLIQADGICHEFLGVQLFQKQGGSPATAKVLERFEANPFLWAYLEPLRILLPLNKNTDEIGEEEMSFNRHAIVHGLSNTYGTEINSLKAISLIAYVSNRFEQIAKETNTNVNA